MILWLHHLKAPLPFARGGHSGRTVAAAGRTAERTHCDTSTDYNNLSYGREVVGWPSLRRSYIR